MVYFDVYSFALKPAKMLVESVRVGVKKYCNLNMRKYARKLNKLIATCFKTFVASIIFASHLQQEITFYKYKI